MSSPTVEAFSLSHAAILDGATGAEEIDGDIYGVNDSSLEPDTGSYDNEGDDTVMSSWNWLNFATLNVQGGYIPFKLVALMTGEDLVSSGTSPNDWYEMNLWTDRSMNVAPRPMLIRMPSKDADGVVRSLEFVLYRVQFEPITFNGPSYKEGLKVNYNGKALLSPRNETGDLLTGPRGPFRAVGRMVGRPAA